MGQTSSQDWCKTLHRVIIQGSLSVLSHEAVSLHVSFEAALLSLLSREYNWVSTPTWNKLYCLEILRHLLRKYLLNVATTWHQLRHPEQLLWAIRDLWSEPLSGPLSLTPCIPNPRSSTSFDGCLSFPQSLLAAANLESLYLLQKTFLALLWTNFGNSLYLLLEQP